MVHSMACSHIPSPSKHYAGPSALGRMRSMCNDQEGRRLASSGVPYLMLAPTMIGFS